MISIKMANLFQKLSFTIRVIAVSRREFDSHGFLQVVRHADFSERWSEVNLIGLSLWTIRVISHLVPPSDVLHHS